MAEKVVVTGASRGIGREVARQLSAEGYRVVLVVRSPTTAPILPSAATEVADLGSTTSIEALVKRLAAAGEKLDVLVNNAGVYRGVDARTVWDVNVRAPLHLTRGLVPLLRDGARVVMVSSGLGRLSGQDPSFLARLSRVRNLDDMEALSDEMPDGYGASKAALNRLAQLFAEQLRARHILVNAVSPGWARTDMGGPSAPRSVEQGAASVLWACHLTGDEPTGGFFEDGRPAE
jgi:carbonyl reductase 1